MGGGGGLCVTRNFPVGTAEPPGPAVELGSAPERGCEAEPPPRGRSRRRHGAPPTPPPGDRPGATLGYRQALPSESSRNPAIFTSPPLSARTYFSIALRIGAGAAALPGTGLRPRPGRAPRPGPPEPAGTYVVAEGKGPSEEWFITRDWKSVRLKTSSQPAAIFLIEDRSPFPKSARRQ